MNLFFSIIIPTYNRPSQLKQCLRALTKLEYPKFEVIVVDDGSWESLENILRPFQSDLQLTLVVQKNHGPANARNHGATIAKGEYLVFTDDDCLPTKTWLSSFAETLQINPDKLVGGKTLNSLPNNPYAKTSQAIMEVAYNYYHQEEKPLRFFASNSNC